jgi:hypothetical protein
MLGRIMAVATKKLSGPSFAASAAAARPSNVISTMAAFPSSLFSGYGTTAAATLQLPPQSQNCRRWHWQIHLTKKFDKESGTYKYEEWTVARALKVTKAALREPMLVDGTSLLSRDLARTAHVKPTRARKLRKEEVEYNRKMKRCDDLLRYIQFINDKKMNK